MPLCENMHPSEMDLGPMRYSFHNPTHALIRCILQESDLAFFPSRSPPLALVV